MKASGPQTEFRLWRKESLFNIDFATYSLSHHHFPRHFHEHYVIELVLNGVDSFYCAGRNYLAGNNQLVLINPGEVHTGNTVSDLPLKYVSFYPDQHALEQVAERLEVSLPANFSFQRSIIDSSVVANKLKLLFHSLLTDNDRLQEEELFFDCMHTLLQARELPVNSLPIKDQRIKQVIDFLYTNYRAEISLQQMADLVRLNPFHLVRLFKRTMGLSPYEYLLIIRAEKAKQLLRHGHTVQEAAVFAGFYDSSHLTRTFRKVAAVAPGSFRSSKSQDRTIFQG